MKPHRPFKKLPVVLVLLAFTMATLLAGFMSGFFSKIRSSGTLFKASQVEWVKYTSVNAGLSFDYPKGWIVFDRVLSEPTLKDETKFDSYNSLWVCPPASELIATPKAELNNCLTFYTKTRIIDPMAGPEDESLLFKDFKQYVQDSIGQDYSNVRLIKYNPDETDSGAIGLVGLFRNKLNLVGLSQLLCATGEDAECMLSFRHVLNSVQFLGQN